MVQGLSLLGFLDQATAFACLEKRYVTPDPSPGRFLACWKQAAQLLGPPFHRAGYPDIQPLPDRPHFQAIVSHPRFPKLLRDYASYSFRLVEIDPLLAIQFDVVTQGIAPAAAGVPAPTLDELLPGCLPTTSAPAAWRQELSAENPRTTRLVSPDVNFRGFSAEVVVPDPLAEFVRVGVCCGPRLPWLRVGRFQGRCFLLDGYHRAYRYRLAGATHLPCLLLEASTFKATGAEQAGSCWSRHFDSFNPPTVGHFTQGRAYPVDIRPVEAVIEVTWKQYFRPRTD